jgi:hypothetical protein
MALGVSWRMHQRYEHLLRPLVPAQLSESCVVRTVVEFLRRPEMGGIV